MNTFGQKVVNQTQKTAKQTAVSMAKKVAQEQLEVLKSARAQVSGVESLPQNQESEFVPTQSQEAPDTAYEQMKAESDAKSRQLLQQLEGEIEKIRQEKKQKEMMQTQQEEQVKVQQTQQEEKKKETMMQKVTKMIKGRIAGKREMKQGPSG